MLVSTRRVKALLLSAMCPLSAAIALAFLPAWAPGQPIYTITDLGTIGGPFSGGQAINAAGQVTGIGYVSGTPSNPGPYHAFRSSTLGQPVSLTDLGTLGGNLSVGYGINAGGQVTGNSTLAGGGGDHAFRTTATGRVSDPGTDLGTFPGGLVSTGSAINTSGQVTGYAIVSGSIAHAYRTSPTGRVSDPGTDLGALFTGGSSRGYGINDAGQVVGAAEYAPPTPPNLDGPTHSFRTTATGLVSDPGADLGTLGGTTSEARAINGSGQVTGSSRIASDAAVHAFRSTPNGQPVVLTDLGTLGGNQSGGEAINSFGVIVGYSLMPTPNTTHAFIYDNQMRDLNSLIPPGSGWVLTGANGINDLGQITGVGQIGGLGHAFLLTPIAVPEPATSFLIAVAALPWFCRRLFLWVNPAIPSTRPKAC